MCGYTHEGDTAPEKCPHCGARREKLVVDKPTNFFLGKRRIYPNEIREWLERMQDGELKFFGLNPCKVH